MRWSQSSMKQSCFHFLKIVACHVISDPQVELYKTSSRMIFKRKSVGESKNEIICLFAGNKVSKLHKCHSELNFEKDFFLRDVHLGQSCWVTD